MSILQDNLLSAVTLDHLLLHNLRLHEVLRLRQRHLLLYDGVLLNRHDDRLGNDDVLRVVAGHSHLLRASTATTCLGVRRQAPNNCDRSKCERESKPILHR